MSIHRRQEGEQLSTGVAACLCEQDTHEFGKNEL